MNEKLMEQATFAEICKILKNRDESCALRACIAPMVQLLSLVTPGLLYTNYDSIDWVGDVLDKGLTVLDTSEYCKRIITQIKEALGKSESNYVKQANNAFTAYILIVYTAFFDAAKDLIDQSGQEIQFDGFAKWVITKKAQESLEEQSYQGKMNLVDESLWIPGPAELDKDVNNSLLHFYSLMRNPLEAHLMGLQDFDVLSHGQKLQLHNILEQLPQKALDYYHKLYQQLSTEFPCFAIWTRRLEHKQIRDQVILQGQQAAKAHEQILSAIDHLPENLQSYEAKKILDNLAKSNRQRIKEALFDSFEMTEEMEMLKLPGRENSFFPQKFSYHYYRGMGAPDRNQMQTDRNRNSLEDCSDWTEGQELIDFISRAIHHQAATKTPLLILGGPGAGKTMLSQMLAGKYLCDAYHVILIRLRDLGNDSSSYRDITKQIDVALGKSGQWEKLMEVHLQKPVLLIFDGYDELVMATGLQLQRYLRRIKKFLDDQNCCGDDQDDNKTVVHAIVTSRINLINQAEIPHLTTVIRLEGLDDTNIQNWIEVWNNHNRQHFLRAGLKPFSLPDNRNIQELAKQPLFLLMLALYDAGENSLVHEYSLKPTELYYRLIRRFIGREEKKKNDDFDEYYQAQDVDQEVERLGLAALGMYNRDRRYIRKNQLNQDFEFMDVPTLHDLTGKLDYGERLLRRFFFVRHIDSETSQDCNYGAYEFLHDSFGEFLTAHYVVNRFTELKNGAQPGKAWYVCMSYVPLPVRYNVMTLLEQWASVTLRQSSWEKEKAWLRKEIACALRGNLLSQIQDASGGFIRDGEEKAPVDLLYHLAVYTCNLMCLGALIMGEVELNRLEREIPRAWWRLLRLWQMSLSEGTMFKISQSFEIEDSETPVFIYSPGYHGDYNGTNLRSRRSTMLTETYSKLCLEPERSLIAILDGSYPEIDIKKSYDLLKKQDLYYGTLMILHYLLIDFALDPWEPWDTMHIDDFVDDLLMIFSRADTSYPDASLSGAYLILKYFAECYPDESADLMNNLARQMMEHLTETPSDMVHNLITDLLLKTKLSYYDKMLIVRADDHYIGTPNKNYHNKIRLIAGQLDSSISYEFWTDSNWELLINGSSDEKTVPYIIQILEVALKARTLLKEKFRSTIEGCINTLEHAVLNHDDPILLDIISGLLRLVLYPYLHNIDLSERIWHQAEMYGITIADIYKAKSDIAERLCQFTADAESQAFCLARLQELVAQCADDLSVKHYKLIREFGIHIKDSSLLNALDEASL